jgi:uncharacterized protein (DUF433 family)
MDTSIIDQIVVKDPERLWGTPTFAGTRVPAAALFDYLAGGHSLDEFLSDFPSVERETAVKLIEAVGELVVSSAKELLPAKQI